MVDRVALDDLRDDIARCYTSGHWWDDNPTAEVDSELFRASFAIQMERCARCGKERFYYLGHDMRPFSKYYRDPPGYQQIAKGQGGRPNLRAELLGRSILIRTAPATQPRRPAKKAPAKKTAAKKRTAA